MSSIDSMGDKEMVALALIFLGSIYLVWKAIGVYSAIPSAIHILRGPKSPSWLSGNNEVVRGPYLSNGAFENLTEEYGTTFPVHGWFGSKELFTADTQAMAFVLNQPHKFHKQKFATKVLRNIMGEGLLVAEGFEHKRQRKIMNPAFGVTAMRDITPMLMDIALELRDAWKKELTQSISGPGWQIINVLPWFNKAALDMIGMAGVLGFGYKFGALHDSSNELAIAFRALSNNSSPIAGIGMLNMIFPFLRHLPIGINVTNNRNRAVRERIGSQMVREKKLEAEQLGGSGTSHIGGKDLLSILIRANTQENVAERLDDKTLLAQISTFLIAGQESTGLTMTWGIDTLARTPSAQSKLRDEALAFPHDSPSMEELNALPYLNNVVKEILRLRPAGTLLKRKARSDTIIPLAQPIIDKNGKQVHELFVRRGDSVLIHLYAANTRTDLWGSDALLFRPERFDELPNAVSDLPSIFGNITSFSAGPTACLGWRMAVLAIKAQLFTLIREFQFDIDPRVFITRRVK
ncbi:hypothetical protein FRB96_009629 [Tulasnella sp. 330]|nr:hypothetical protein FRB96_009629 [Tulasnella sp. 330]